MRERGRAFLDLEDVLVWIAIGALRRPLDQRHAALHRERKAQLGFDIRADAIKRIDERERQLDRAACVVLAADRQAHDDTQRGLACSRRGRCRRERGDLRDRDVLAVLWEARHVQQCVVLERDIACDLVEVVDQARGAVCTELALERRHAAQDALQHVDVLALAIARGPRVDMRRERRGRRAGRPRQALGGHRRGLDRRGHRHRAARDHRGLRDIVLARAALRRLAARVALERRARRDGALLLRHQLRERHREVVVVDQRAGLLPPLEREPAELVLQIARGLEPVRAVERERLQDDLLE